MLTTFRISRILFVLMACLLPALCGAYDGITGTANGVVANLQDPITAEITTVPITTSDLDWHSWFTIALFLLTITALVLEILPPDITMLIAAGILTVAGTVTPTEFLRGFSQDIIITIGMLCVVVRALELNGFLGIVSKYVLSKSSNSIRQLTSIIFPVGVASAFMNNTPIVLMMTSAVRQWAIDHRMSPSKFLIPLSYAAILGGVCTLIGTSSNLIVDGLIRLEYAEAGLGFFELSYIGIPCLLVGALYLLTIGFKLLPSRQDPTTALFQQTKEFTGEFIVGAGCPVVNTTVAEAGRKYFSKELLIEIERGDIVIDAPSPHEVIREGDRLVFAGDISHIASLHTIEGLKSTADPHFKLDITSPHFSEVVIAATSSLIGRTLKETNFRVTYGPSVMAVYRQGRRVEGNLGDVVLLPGDTLMLLTSTEWHPGNSFVKDFFYIRHNEPLQVTTPLRFGVSIASMVGLIVGAIAGVPMMIGSMVAATAVVVARCVTIRQARRSVSWHLLILIASAYTLATALQNTGVALYFAKGLLGVVGTNGPLLLSAIFIITMVLTAFITNNAAVLLLFPIAVQAAHLAGYHSVDSIKAIGVTIAVAASCSFATPIGYQTNMIVYGPGGYRFRDYLKVGGPLSVIILILADIIIPIIWPLG